MDFTLVQLFSYSIGISALLGLVRLKNADQAFLPFILFLWSGLINETVSTFCIYYYRTNAINSNIYVLASSLLLLWLFRNWKILGNKHRYMVYVFGILFLLVWGWENFIYSDIRKFNSYFRILYSFIVVLLSVQMINRLLLEGRTGLLKNAVFLICISFVVFFTYKLLIEIFWIYGLNSSKDFRLEVYRIMTYINLAVNLIYALAIVWIPRKRESLLL